MKNFFRKLPLTYKLLMIGIVPFLFLLYFSVVIYKDKTKTVSLIDNYVHHVDQSQTISELINELAWERRSSYLMLIKDTTVIDLNRHREKVDSIISNLLQTEDLAIMDFPKYTFLDKLKEIRNQVNSKSVSADFAMHYYTNAIFRLNTLKTSVPRNTFLKPVYQDLISQQILSDFITYLGIVRTNIFNVLFTKKYETETLFGTLGVFEVAKTYETEFFLKASPEAIATFKEPQNFEAYSEMISYMDTVFKNFKTGNKYTPDQWWQVSTNALRKLKRQQIHIWKKAENDMDHTYQAERRSKQWVFILLMISVVFVIFFVAYLVWNIKFLLNKLQSASLRLSKGETGIRLKDMPNGVMRKLAESIHNIDKNNLMLAQAANKIGKGDFSVEVKPRSDHDLLGISINKMKHDLAEFTSQKDRVQKETEQLVYRRDEFFSIASHELKTPVTSLKAYTQLLLMDAETHGDEQQKNMLQRMDVQINKITALINDLLDTTKIEHGHLTYNKDNFQLEELIQDIITAILPITPDTELIFEEKVAASVCCDRDRIGQVINNLITNAIKYGSENGKIVISMKKDNDRVVCSVTDFGKGIDPNEIDKIFERFYRISGHNLNTFPGLGLGLYISKDIIEKHGGKIGVSSEVGKGSTFYFELPIQS